MTNGLKECVDACSGIRHLRMYDIEKKECYIYSVEEETHFCHNTHQILFIVQILFNSLV